MKITEKEYWALYFGPVILYEDETAWLEDNSWFEQADYKVFLFDAEKWTTIDVMYSDMQEVFGFPAYFGRNLDALVDCLRDLDPKHTLISIKNYDAWVKTNRIIAQTILDIFAAHSYETLIHGRRFIVNIHTNERLKFKPLNCKEVTPFTNYA